MAITLSDKIAPPPNSFTGMVDASQVLGGAIGGVIPDAAHPALTGDVTVAAGTVATTLAASGVVAGTYTGATVTVDAKGRVTSAVAGAITNFQFNQGSVLATWTITHNLGFRPNVTTFDTTEANIIGDITHASVNQLTVTFATATGGYALLS